MRVQVAISACMMSGLVCAASQPARAQERADHASQGSETEGFREILVTAQRRSQPLRDVPISITALAGDDLAASGVNDIRNLGNLVPGLTFTTQGTFAQPTIRGVQSSVSITGSEYPIAIHVDGFYQPNQVANIFDLPDVARVEVLKGPQGTLFGRNATGGAIMIFTRDPEFTTAGDFRLRYGRYVGGGANASGQFATCAFLTTPLVADRVAASVSAHFDRIGGYLTDDRTGSAVGRVESWSMRARLLFVPAEGLRLLVTGFADHRRDDAAASAQPLNGNTIAQFYPPALIPTRRYHLASELKDSVVPTRSEHHGVTLRADVDIGNAATLTSLTGYTVTDAVTTSDIDAAFAPQCPFPRCLNYNINYGPSRTFQQELTFASRQMGALSFVAGYFFYRDNSDSLTNLNPPLNPDGSLVPGGVGIVNNAAEVRTRAYAGFGELTWDLTDRLHLIGGLRYSVENKEGTARRGISGTPFDFGGLPRARVWSPRVSARFDLSEAANVYATFSRGFKSGVIDSQGFTNEPALPEKINSYEIGTKVGTQTYSLSAAAYLYDYTDLQVQFFNGTRTLIGNAADARIIGIDLDASAEVAPGLRLRVAGSWLPEARYRDFPSAIIFALPNTPTGMKQTVIDASGKRILKAARLGGTISADYSAETGAGLLEVNGTVAYTSGFSWELTDRVRTVKHALLSGQVALTPRASPVRIAIFARNITGQSVVTGTLLAAAIDGVEYSVPRQVGFSLDRRF